MQLDVTITLTCPAYGFKRRTLRCRVRSGLVGVVGSGWCGRVWLVWSGVVGVVGSGWCGWVWLVWLGLVGVVGSGWCGWVWLVWLGLVGVDGSGWCGWESGPAASLAASCVVQREHGVEGGSASCTSPYFARIRSRPASHAHGRHDQAPSLGFPSGLARNRPR